MEELLEVFESKMGFIRRSNPKLYPKPTNIDKDTFFKVPTIPEI